MKKVLLVLVIIGILYLLFWPVPIEPLYYNSPTVPLLEGKFQANKELSEVKHFEVGIGPELIAIDSSGILYTGLQNGKILKFNTENQTFEDFINTGGRSLGIRWNSGLNSILVAAEIKGILSVTTHGKISVIIDNEDGAPFYFLNNIDATKNGVVYFTIASTRYKHDEIEKELWESNPTGKLMSYNISSKKLFTLVDKLRFANGVALSPNESFLFFIKTHAATLKKYWLKGPIKGKIETVINSLPEYPDNITYNGNGIYWIAMVTYRNKIFKELLPRPWIRKFIWRLLSSVRNSDPSKPYGFVIGIDNKGKTLYNFQDSTGRTNWLTSAIEYKGDLWMGSNLNKVVVKYKIN